MFANSVLCVIKAVVVSHTVIALLKTVTVCMISHQVLFIAGN